MAARNNPPLVGIVTPNAKGQLQPEARNIFAGRIETVTRGLNVERLAPHGYKAALARLPAAADALVAAGAEAIAINGTSLNFAFGRAFHDDLVASVARQSGRPVTTMAESLVRALKALDAAEVVLATAYDDEVTGRLAAFLAEDGIRAETGACLGIVENARLRDLTSDDVVALAERAAKGRRMDALVISCGNLRTIGLTNALESRFGVPVISSALVGVWGALRLAGVDEPIPGIGRLFETAPA